MECGTCGADAIAVSVPPAIREHAPDEAATVAVCTSCLRVTPADNAGGEADPQEVSTALPADRDAAVALLLFASLLSSVTGNRQSLEALFDRVERAGADPRLAVERLADDPDLDPAVDLRRRFRQFEGLR